MKCFVSLTGNGTVLAWGDDTCGTDSTVNYLLRSFALARLRFFWIALVGIGVSASLRADPVQATNDYAQVSQNTPITIPVLTNDVAAMTNELAILRVTQPPHGRVIINTQPAAVPPLLAPLFDFAAFQLSNSVVEIAVTNLYPRNTDTNGVWQTRISSWANWVSGYFPGLMWYIYGESGDTNFSNWAQLWMAGIAPMQYSTDVDDVATMIDTSYGNGYRTIGNPAWQPVLLQAAESVSERFNPAVGCVVSWGSITDSPCQVVVDSMMNIELLFRAYDMTGNTNFYNFARSHAERTMLNHVRSDGSTYQLVKYDRDTGAVVWRGTWAGASDDSTWARGQSWAIYGFTMAFRETKDLRFLQTAQLVADYYLAHVPSDHVPYWDYQAPGIPDAPRDSSAAAIALSGLIELSELATNSVDSARYWQEAQRIFSSLGSNNYLAQGTPSAGILLHGTGESPIQDGTETDVSLIYGDYYFVEALKRYRTIYSQKTVTYIPNAGFVGTDTFAYDACDSAGNCSEATVTVTVVPANGFTLTISFSQNGHFPEISFPSQVGRVYAVEFEDALSLGGSWSPLVTNMIGDGTVLSIDDTNLMSHRFYRVRSTSQ